MIYLSLGSNEGNRFDNLRKAIALLKQQNFRVVQESIVLETEAIVPLHSPNSWNKPYLNMIIAGNTKSRPEQFLASLQSIEQALGRNPVHDRWSPRSIDLDILLWNDELLNNDHLKIPHPEISSRPFLLHLLAMMDCLLRCPSTNRTFAEIAHQTIAFEQCFSKSFVLNPRLVGVVNVTPDSFSDGNLYFDSKLAAKQAMQLSEDGAEIIEIGGQSTRPTAIMVGADQEWQRLEPVLDELNQKIKNGYNLTISIDSFLPEVINKALQHYPIAWVNDVKGDLDDKTLRQIASHNCKIVVMHSLSIPPTKEKCIDFNVAPKQTLANWAKQKIAHLIACGFSKEQIILDPGIGFSKSAYQNLAILGGVEALKEFGCPILIGHSRKSYISSFYHSKADMRDLATIAISAKLHDLKVDYLRIHNVKEHMQFFVAKQAVFKENYSHHCYGALVTD